MNEIRLDLVQPVSESCRRPILRQLVAVIRHRVAVRRQRRALARLDDRLLRDIGVDREAARKEAAKPIWRS